MKIAEKYLEIEDYASAYEKLIKSLEKDPIILLRIGELKKSIKILFKYTKSKLFS